MPKKNWVFIAFITESQLLSSWLKQGEFLWLSLQNLNCIDSAWGRVDFYNIYYKFLIIVISPE